MSEDLERPDGCLVCLGSGVVELTDGEIRKCPRGCPQPEDFRNTLVLPDKPRLIQPEGWPRDLDGHPVKKERP